MRTTIALIILIILGLVGMMRYPSSSDLGEATTMLAYSALEWGYAYAKSGNSWQETTEAFQKIVGPPPSDYTEAKGIREI